MSLEIPSAQWNTMKKRTDNRPAEIIRYNLEPGIFHDPRFLAIPGATPSSALLLLYLMSGPLAQRARIPGLIFTGAGALADNLKWTYQQVQDSLAELISSGWVAMDQQRNIIWVSRSAKNNPPDNPSIIQGWASSWAEVGDSHLRAQIWEDLHTVIKERGGAYDAAFRGVFQTVTRDGVVHGVHHPVETPWGDTVGGHRVNAQLNRGCFQQPVNGKCESNCHNIYNMERTDTCMLLGAETLGVAGVGFRLGVSVPCLFSSEQSEEDTQDLRAQATPRKRVPAKPTPASPSPDTPKVVPGNPMDTPDTLRTTPRSPGDTPDTPAFAPGQVSPSPSASGDSGGSESDDDDFEPFSADFDASPFKALYYKWNRLGDIPGSKVHKIAAAQIARFDGMLTDEVTKNPNYLDDRKADIERIARHRWLLGLTANKDGSYYEMWFTTLLNKPEWVRKHLDQQAREEKRKPKPKADVEAAKARQRQKSPTPSTVTNNLNERMRRKEN